MGCGRSKASKDDTAKKADQDNYDIYQKSAKGDSQKSNASNGTGQVAPEPSSEGTLYSQTNGDLSAKENNSSLSSKDKVSSGPLQQNTIEENCDHKDFKKKITASQVEFFRMLDEKIEKGKDYESDITDS